ncbi:MAG: DUF4815 domain-containing protein [Candidatus Polarisedimenticolaceae bacterium]|nr:DUF4815 domain-containing protein [Candidatus Polarisedimenticolaceae bacterium]
MKTERSRNSFDALKRYSGVYQQMGRMFTDSDWNELTDMAKHRLAEARTDVIGSGSPRDRGIMKVDSSSGTDVYSLQWGYAYVDGIIAQLRPDLTATLTDPNGEAFEYDSQADFPAPPSPVGDHTLYLDVWERTVLSLEDDALRDPGLRGADTCTRTQTMAQVKWCSTTLNPEDPADNPPIGNAELTLELTEGSSEIDPCDPCANEVVLQDKVGNYLFRVEVHSVEYSGSNPTQVVLKWSRENGAEQHVIGDEPVGFASENWAYEFYSGETEAFASEKHLGRHLASGFSPTVGVLEKGYPDSVPANTSLVRRWDGYCVLNKVGLNWQLGGGSDRGVDLSTTSDVTDHGHLTVGATVTIKLDAITLQIALAANQLLAGDFWAKEVRQAVNQLGDILLSAERPQGITHHYLTLGMMTASGDFTLHASDHCKRYSFPPLTDIRASDVCYEVLACGDTGEQTTVRRLLEERLGADFPNPGVATQVSTILDALLCQHSAATLPLLKNQALCTTLKDDSIQSVQDALNALCTLKASGCCSITIYPEANWQDAILALPQEQDANICFRPGDYYLDDTLLIENKGHLKISGAGAGTRIICSSREAALHFSNCSSISVAAISVEAGAVGHNDQHEYLYGALTISGCEKVTIDHVALKCTAGTRLGATCLTVSNSRRRSGTLSVTGCDLSVGHKQTGMLLLNMQQSFVQNNSIKVRQKPASLTLERQLVDTKFAANARKLLINNAVIRNFEDVSTAGMKNLHMSSLNNRQIYINSPVSSNDWRNAISQQAGDTNVASNQHLLSIARNTARRVLTDRSFRLEYKPFNDWFEVLRDQNPACAHAGIVCAGQVASDIQILNNFIKGAQEGIHVGVSDRSLKKRREFTAGRVLISANNINLIVPPIAERRRGGIFVGNCNNLTIQDNQILAQRFPLSRNIVLEGVRVYGHLGRMMMVRQNYMTHCNTGVRIKPLDTDKGSVQWLVSDNMMVNANLPVDAPSIVQKFNNRA